MHLNDSDHQRQLANLANLIERRRREFGIASEDDDQSIGTGIFANLAYDPVAWSEYRAEVFQGLADGEGHAERKEDLDAAAQRYRERAGRFQRGVA